LGLNGLGLNGLAINGLGINGLGINGLGLGINGLGVRTLGVNNLGLINGAPLAYNALPMAAPAPIVAAPVPIAAPMVTSSQYHAQTELGEASHGYSFPGQAASNMRDAMGNQIGSWAYINPEGKEVKVSYVADSLGFRVLSNDLPVAPVALPVPPVMLPIDDGVAPLPVMDTVEVMEAKIAHMAAMEAAKSGIIPVRTDLPVPVEDTEEVKAAKAEHAEAKAKVVEESKGEEVKAEEVKVEETKDRKKRQILNGLWGGLVGAAPIVRSEVAISAPMTRDAVLTQIVHNPGHAMSYRVD